MHSELDLIQAMIKAKPDDPQLYFRLAQYFTKTGQILGARNAYLKALQPIHQDYFYYISDMKGNLVMKGQLRGEGQNREVKLDVSRLSSGSYIVKTQAKDGKSYLNKLIKLD